MDQICQDKKSVILDAAIHRFKHYGFVKTKLSEIAQDLKMSNANLYYYYPDKCLLIKDVLAVFSKNYMKGISRIAQNKQLKVIEVFMEILNYRKKFVQENYLVYLSENYEWIKGDELRNLLYDIHMEEVDFYETLFQRGVETGEFREIDVRLTAETYVEVIKSLNLLFNIGDIISLIPSSDNLSFSLEKQKTVTEIMINGLIKN